MPIPDDLRLAPCELIEAMDDHVSIVKLTGEDRFGGAGAVRAICDLCIQKPMDDRPYPWTMTYTPSSHTPEHTWMRLLRTRDVPSHIASPQHQEELARYEERRAVLDPLLDPLLDLLMDPPVAEINTNALVFKKWRRRGNLRVTLGADDH